MNKKDTISIQSKNNEWDGTYQLLSWWKSDVIKDAKVMVVGAGALGNEVLKNLTLLNVGNIVIVDFDTIEYSNLSRSVLYREKDCERKALKSEIAAERIKEINKNVKVKSINGDVTIDVGLGVFRRMDVIIGCLDNRLARLFLNRACFKVGKTWVDGAIENLTGQVNVYHPPKTCYECSLSKADWQNIKFKLGCVDVAKRNYSQGRIPTTPISSSIVAAMQTQEALKVVNGNFKKLMLESFYYEGMNNLVLQLKPSPIKDHCFSHYEYENIIESTLSADDTIKEALFFLKDYFKDDKLFIKLDNEVALKLVTRKSEKVFNTIIPKLKLTDEKMQEYTGDSDEEIMIVEETDEIDFTFSSMDKKLTDLGIPHLHILRVYSKGKLSFVELSKDIDFLNFN